MPCCSSPYVSGGVWGPPQPAYARPVRVGAFVAQYELVRHSSSDDWQHANRAASTARDVLNVFGIFFLVEAVSEFVVRW